MITTLLIIFAFLTLLIVQLVILAVIKRGQRKTSLCELLNVLKSLKQQIELPASSAVELRLKLQKVLESLNSDFGDLPDSVDIHLGDSRAAIRALNDTVGRAGSISSEVLDFTNSYLAKLQSISSAISIVERELKQVRYLPIGDVTERLSKQGKVIKWLRRSDISALITCAVTLLSIYIALSVGYERAISVAGMVIVVLGLIYEAQYLPRFSSRGEFRAKTIGAGGQKNIKRRPAEFLVTHFGFFQIIIGTVLSSIGSDLIKWLTTLMEIIKSCWGT